MSPNKGNLLYAAKYLHKNHSIEMAFSSLIFELKANNVSTQRTIIYCQTRKQCSIVYPVFEVYLGKDMYHEQPTPRNRTVDVYHAGTAKSTFYSHIRVLPSYPRFTVISVFYPLVRPSVRISVRPSRHPSGYLSVHPSGRIFVRPSVRPSVSAFYPHPKRINCSKRKSVASVAGVASLQV